MKANILIANKDATPALDLVSKLTLEHADLTFVDDATRALKNIKRNAYDLIIIGDKLSSGDAVDLALEIKTSKRNRNSAIVYIGYNKFRATKVVNTVSPYGFQAVPEEFDTILPRLNNYFSSKEEQGSGVQ